MINLPLLTKHKVPGVFWEPGMTLDVVEREVIKQAMYHFKGNIMHTSAALGVTRATLYKRLTKYFEPSEINKFRRGSNGKANTRDRK